MDYELLQKSIKNAARLAFDSLREKYPNQVFCGYALYSDNDAITVCPAVNSEENLNQMVLNDPTDRVYYQWSVGEWDHESEGVEFFMEISKHLYQQRLFMENSEELMCFRNLVYEACVSALESMKDEGYFRSESDCVLVFSITDSSHDNECEWIDRLNKPRVSLDFKNWLCSLDS